MPTDIHPPGPKAAKKQIKPPKFDRKLSPTCLKKTLQLKPFSVIKSDSVPATGRVFFSLSV